MMLRNQIFVGVIESNISICQQKNKKLQKIQKESNYVYHVLLPITLKPVSHQLWLILILLKTHISPSKNPYISTILP